MPAARKRQLTLSGASIDADALQPVKRARTIRELTAAAASTASDLELENRELKKLVADAFAFIEKKELISQAPASIQKAMFARPNGVGLETHAASMVSRMSNIRKSLAKATENHRRTLTTSEDISKRAVPLFDEIRTTILTSTEPRRFKIAYKLVIQLQRLSYAYPSSYDERDSDPIADELLVELAKERFAAGERWGYLPDMWELQEQHKYLAKFGIETYFPKFIAKCSDWWTLDVLGWPAFWER